MAMTTKVKPNKSSIMQNAMAFNFSIFRRQKFNSYKCKIEAKMAIERIKQLRNTQEAIVQQRRQDVAMLLKSSQENIAMIRVERAIREENHMIANEMIAYFCEIIIERLPLITSQRYCPTDMKEVISSLIYAAPRCSEISELRKLRKIFRKKYGEDFIYSAENVLLDSGVSNELIAKLSVSKPAAEVKLKTLKEIAKEYKIECEGTESEVSHSFLSPMWFLTKHPQHLQQKLHDFSSGDKRENDIMLSNPFSTIQAAAEFAEKVVSALAQTSTYFANGHPVNELNHEQQSQKQPSESVTSSFNETKSPRIVLVSKNLNQSSKQTRKNTDNVIIDTSLLTKNNSPEKVRSDINFDDSDASEPSVIEESEVKSSQLDSIPHSKHPVLERQGQNEEDENRQKYINPPYVHPKLPDYSKLIANYKVLKSC